MLGRRRRRRASIKSTLAQYIVFLWGSSITTSSDLKPACNAALVFMCAWVSCRGMLLRAYAPYCLNVSGVQLCIVYTTALKSSDESRAWQTDALMSYACAPNCSKMRCSALRTMYGCVAKIIEFMRESLPLLKQLNYHCRWVRMCRHALVWRECGSGKEATIQSPGGAVVFVPDKLFISNRFDGMLKISNFTTRLYRTVIKVNYLFHAESARK